MKSAGVESVLRHNLPMHFLLAAATMLGALASAQSASDVPDHLKPPANERLARQVRAEGEQIYNCDGASWVLVGPDAKLFDENGKQSGTHFAGPTWEWNDGSRVVGRPVANAILDPDSIPWLLLTATDQQGEGVMKLVSSIQRLSTKGGKAPATGCDASHKGEKTRSHYTAVYRFYARGQ
jgi:hypothetical protein